MTENGGYQTQKREGYMSGQVRKDEHHPRPTCGQVGDGQHLQALSTRNVRSCSASSTVMEKTKDQPATEGSGG